MSEPQKKQLMSEMLQEKIAQQDKEIQALKTTSILQLNKIEELEKKNAAPKMDDKPPAPIVDKHEHQEQNKSDKSEHGFNEADFRPWLDCPTCSPKMLAFLHKEMGGKESEIIPCKHCGGKVLGTKDFWKNKSCPHCGK